MDSHGFPRGPPLAARTQLRHRAFHLAQSHPLLSQGGRKENLTPLEEMLHPSPFPRQLRKSLLRPLEDKNGRRRSSLNLTLEEEQEEEISAARPAGKGKRVQLPEVKEEEDSVSWLGRVRQKLSPVRRDVVGAEASSRPPPSPRAQPGTTRKKSPPQRPDSSPSSPPLLAAAANSSLAPNPPAPLPSTLGLPPTRHPLMKQGGFIELLPTGEVVLDLRGRMGRVLLLSGGSTEAGESISIFHLRPPPSSSSSSTLILLHPPEEKYTLDTLPPEWWKAYRLCARFVEAIRTRTVRMSVHLSYPSTSTSTSNNTQRVKLQIFSDSYGSYRLTFPPSSDRTSPLKIHLSCSRSTLSLSVTDNLHLNLNLPLSASTADSKELLAVLPSSSSSSEEEIKSKVRWSLEQQGLVERLCQAL